MVAQMEQKVVDPTRTRSIVNREIPLPEGERQDANRLAVARGRKVVEIDQNHLSLPVQCRKGQSISSIAWSASRSRLIGTVPDAVPDARRHQSETLKLHIPLDDT